MPQFAITCFDKPNSLELRMATRPTHLVYLQGQLDAGVVLMAGPLLDADDKPNGSLLLVETADRAAAEAFAAGDPYAKAGLFASTDIRPWRKVFG
jgi:uncharacterized protein YciI